MNRNDIELILSEAKEVTNHTDYVIVGSLSILGASAEPPLDMAASVDIDLYPKNDPGRAFEVATALGETSPFGLKHGYYADAVSPDLPALPDGWKDRLVKIEFENGINAWFLEPNDAAVSKYVRNEHRDRGWTREGLAAGILSVDTIEYGLRYTDNATVEERQVARKAIAEDLAWLDRKRSNPDEPAIHKRLVVSLDGIATSQTSLDGQSWSIGDPEVAPPGLRPGTYNLTRAKPVDVTQPGPVTGIVIHTDDKYVYQEKGVNNIARHEVRSFAQPPEVGRYARFKYENGKAVDLAPAMEKGRGLSR